MMGVSGAAGFDHEVALSAQANANQVMMDSARSQEAMQRNAALINVAVRENQDALAFTNRRLGTGADRFEGLAQAGVSWVVGGIHRHGGKALLRQPADALELGLGQHGRRQADATGVIRRLLKDIALRAQIHFQGHHD